ncbi:MAG TPA: ATP-dependent zinc metalloprotease FtsH [Actinomycetaceae bacterium]|nr:ATP-dependent zinc metalloprotease FtsH [Actinomycetaceae bacterium]
MTDQTQRDPTENHRDDPGPAPAGKLERRNDTKDHDPQPWRTEGLPPGAGDDPEPPRFNWARLIGWGMAVYLLSFLVLTVFGGLVSQTVTVSYTDFTQQVANGNVSAVYSKGDTIEGRLIEPATDSEGREYSEFVTERPTWATDNLFVELQDQGTEISATSLVEQVNPLANLFWSLLPLILLVLFWRWLFRRQRSMMGDAIGGGGGLFGGGKKKPVDPEEVRVTFDDVAGIDEVKAEINEVVDYLKNPDKYRALGAKAPKGVLLTGEPGTGKTLLARATAGEAGVPFFSASASEFIEMVVGVGAQRVRELFSEARKVAPSIIFIDEIDTIGRARGGARSVGGHDEREQTLNQILTEMDGFTGSEGVIVMAATNRPDVLDPALLRPGRFDRQITVHAPDAKGRVEIMEVHSRGVPMADDVDLEAIAKATPGLTGADLANLINEAAISAARERKTHVNSRHLWDALEKTQLGAARDVVMPEDQRQRTAYHEAGHALLGMLRPGADPVRKVSIIPRGRALGVTVSTPESDRYGYDEYYLRGRIVGALGGMAAEDVVYGVITTGAESDLQTSTNIARSMVGRWGMSPEIGPLQIYPNEGDPRASGFSDELFAKADAEARRIVDECYDEATTQLRDNRDKLDGIVIALLEKETLEEQEVYAAAGIEKQPEAPIAAVLPVGEPTTQR